MNVILVLSVAFLLCPVVGYIVILLDMSLRAKILIAALAVVVLTLVPILILVFAGGGGGN